MAFGVNSTLICLSASCFALSPFISRPTSMEKSGLSLERLKLSKFFPSALLSSNSPGNISACFSTFRIFMSTPLVIDSLSYSTVYGPSPYQYSSIALFSFCNFIRCSSSSYGGALNISAPNSNLVIYANIFDDCNATIRGGAIYSNSASCYASYNCFYRCTAFRTSDSYAWDNACYFYATNLSYFNYSIMDECSFSQITNCWDGCCDIGGCSAVSSNLNFSLCYAPATAGFSFGSSTGSLAQFTSFLNLSGGCCYRFWATDLSQSTFQYVNSLGCSVSMALFYLSVSSSSVTISHVVIKGLSGSQTGSGNSYGITLSDCVSDTSATFYGIQAVNTWICKGNATAQRPASATFTGNSAEMRKMKTIFSLFLIAKLE